jgi:hypothetical protein
MPQTPRLVSRYDWLGCSLVALLANDANIHDGTAYFLGTFLKSRLLVMLLVLGVVIPLPAQQATETFTVKSVFISGNNCDLSIKSAGGTTYYASAFVWQCDSMMITTGTTLSGYVKTTTSWVDALNGKGPETDIVVQNGTKKNGKPKWIWLAVSSQSR